MDHLRYQSSIIFAYGFRPFFLLLPLYLIISVGLWGLQWAGVVSFFQANNPIEWHIYELIFGASAAGIAGFLLTAIPEFYDELKPVTGKHLALLVLLWIIGRLCFWNITFATIHLTALSHVLFTLLLIALVYKPILSDPQRRHHGLLFALLLLFFLQALFFAAKLHWLTIPTLSILKLSVGAMMILVLLVVRRVSTGMVNELFAHWQIDDTFLAKPPRYNMTIFVITIFTLCEFFIPDNAILGWLGFACGAALLNLLNDYFETDYFAFFRKEIWPMWLIIVFMACGYGLMGYDYLDTTFYAINHFRHFLVTGSIGLAYLMVFFIVSMVHTGRAYTLSPIAIAAILLLIASTLVRAFALHLPITISLSYLISAVLWASAFALYLYECGVMLLKPRADGLPG